MKKNISKSELIKYIEEGSVFDVDCVSFDGDSVVLDIDSSRTIDKLRRNALLLLSFVFFFVGLFFGFFLGLVLMYAFVDSWLTTFSLL